MAIKAASISVSSASAMLSSRRRRLLRIIPVEGGSNGWGCLVLPPLGVCLVLLVLSQTVFVGGSFHRDLGAGRVGTAWQLINYQRIVTDDFYARSLWVSVKVSALATLGTLALAYPVAYVIARMRSRAAMLLMAGIVASTFITIVVKVFGLMIIFANGGILNRTLIALGIISEPVALLGSQTGVVVGLMQFTLGFAVLLLYGVIQTIPRSLEEAAQAHGAGRWRVLWRILLPLSVPGLAIGGLMIFNMCMGAFTSAALLGGGRILTLPVLIERTIMMEVKYSMAATLSVVLVAVVAVINLVSILALRHLRAGHKMIA